MGPLLDLDPTPPALPSSIVSSVPLGVINGTAGYPWADNGITSNPQSVQTTGAGISNAPATVSNAITEPAIIQPPTSTLIKLQQTIGGSDLSVFYVTEVPNFSDVMASPGTPWLWSTDIVMFELDSVLSVSYSSVREVFAARTLGSHTPSGFTRGAASISGHIAFAVFTNDVLQRLREQMNEAALQYKQAFFNKQQQIDGQPTPSENYSANSAVYYDLITQNLSKAKMLNELDPFHIYVMGVNEQGAFSKLMLKDIRIIDENQYHGIQQPNIVNKVTFVAGDMVPLTSNDIDSVVTFGNPRRVAGTDLFNQMYQGNE